MTEKTIAKSFSDDLEQNRQFEIGGEIFKWRYPHWTEMAAIFDEDVQTIRSQNGDKQPTTKESIEVTIKRIKIFLDPEGASHKRFDTLAKRKEDPVPMHQFSKLYVWLLETASGRPTLTPSPSEPGPGNAAASSAAGSRSRGATQTP